MTFFAVRYIMAANISGDGESDMIAKREVWNYSAKNDVWVGKYLNSKNLPHWHSDCELICVDKGELEAVCENKRYVLGEKDAFFIDSEQVHYMQAQRPDTVVTVIIFGFGIIKNLFGGKTLTCPKLGDFYNVNLLYESIKRELKEKLPFYNEAVKGMINRFFIDVLRREKAETRKEKSVSDRLKTLIDKINNEYDSITFNEAYRFMAMDEAYFCRYFKKATGMSYTQYVNHIRIDNATKMLKEGSLSVTDVAIACGFGSIRHFNKTFKDITGYAPRNMPEDFVLTEHSFHTDNEFNPTLADCVLLEQF